MSVPVPGPYAANYENYISKIFKPANSKLLISTALSEYSNASDGENIPASMQLKHEKENTDALWDPSPLESMFSLYETSGLQDPMPKYPVYQPKRSSEYYSIANKKPLVTESSAFTYRVAQTRVGNIYSSPNSYDETTYTLKPDARRFSPNYKAKYFLVDYQTFKTNDRPIAQHMNMMTPSSAANRYNSRDTRILGSNFAILSLRGPDAWFERVDKLLKEAKEC